VLEARALQALGRNREAVVAWDEAVAGLDHPQPDDYLVRARLLVDLGRVADARESLREGLARLGPGTALIHALGLLGGTASVPLPRPDAAAPPIVESPSLPEIHATITRGPYLQRPHASGVTVRWRTSSAENSRVQFGQTPGGFYSDHVDDATSTTEHVIVLTGLTPGTRYYYTVGPTPSPTMTGDSLTFETSPPSGHNEWTRIWVLGDSGLPGLAQNRVRDAFVAWTGTRGADVWLMLGDNAYNSGLDSEFQSGLFTPYRSQLQRWPLWLTRGNHDVLYSGTNNDYYDFFTFPTAAEAGGTVSSTEAYYSFDYGPVHFICLDSEGTTRTPGSAMLTWLAGDLAANSLPWTIAYWHHPPYTKGSHDSDDAADSGGRMRDMRQYALPILEAAGVDLVLTGHSHSYERSFLLDGHYGLSTTLTPAMKKNPGNGRPNGDGPYYKSTFGSGPHEGVVYAVDGSGAQIEGGTLDHPAMVSSLNVLGSMVIDVNGDRMDARFLSDLGVVRDSFTVLKGAVTAVRGRSLERDGLELGPAIPNPFREGVTIEFTLARSERVRLEIFDASGRRVATLASRWFDAGRHTAGWNGSGPDGRPLPAGIYTARLRSGERQVSRTIALIR
jgi:hypothetical protein